MRPRRSARLVLGTAVTLAVTGATATMAMASPGGEAPDGGTVSIVAQGPGPEELFQCLTAHGGEVSTVPGPDGTAGKGFVAKSDDPEQQAALEACEQFLPQGGEQGQVCVPGDGVPAPNGPVGPVGPVGSGGSGAPGAPGVPGAPPEANVEFRAGEPVFGLGFTVVFSDGATVVSSVGPVIGTPGGPVISAPGGAVIETPEDTVVGDCPIPVPGQPGDGPVVQGQAAVLAPAA